MSSKVQSQGFKTTWGVIHSINGTLQVKWTFRKHQESLTDMVSLDSMRGQ